MARGALWYLSETLLGTWLQCLKAQQNPRLATDPSGKLDSPIWLQPSSTTLPTVTIPIASARHVGVNAHVPKPYASDMESDMDLDTDPEAEAPPANQIIELIELLALVELQEAIQKRLLPSDFAVQLTEMLKGLGIGDGISVGTGVEMVVMSQLSAICDTIAADKKANKSWLERIEEALRKANNTKAPQTISTSPN
ncbi:hypothetical protein EV368DRAFT_68558 [Lentinula lateritia]|nr:hypothetical protein EV368DRAFT_68558 [Lentinula lateritia]